MKMYFYRKLNNNVGRGRRSRGNGTRIFRALPNSLGPVSIHAEVQRRADRPWRAHVADWEWSQVFGITTWSLPKVGDGSAGTETGAFLPGTHDRYGDMIDFVWLLNWQNITWRSKINRTKTFYEGFLK